MGDYKLSALVEREGAFYVAYCMELLVSSQGKTIEEALENLKEALSLYVKHADPEEIEHLKRSHAHAPLIATLSIS